MDNQSEITVSVRTEPYPEDDKEINEAFKKYYYGMNYTPSQKVLMRIVFRAGYLAALKAISAE